MIIGSFLTLSLAAQSDTLEIQPPLDSIAANNVGNLLGADTSLLSQSDSLLVAQDSTLTDSLAAPTPTGDIETTINYNSTDSIFFDMNSQNLSMYGESHIDYGG